MTGTSSAAASFPNGIALPDPDKIREAIDEADERSRLLRRLLRVALRLRHHGRPNIGTVRQAAKAAAEVASP